MGCIMPQQTVFGLFVWCQYYVCWGQWRCWGCCFTVKMLETFIRQLVISHLFFSCFSALSSSHSISPHLEAFQEVTCGKTSRKDPLHAKPWAMSYQGDFVFNYIFPHHGCFAAAHHIPLHWFLYTEDTLAGCGEHAPGKSVLAKLPHFHSFKLYDVHHSWAVSA